MKQNILQVLDSTQYAALQVTQSEEIQDDKQNIKSNIFIGL